MSILNFLKTAGLAVTVGAGFALLSGAAFERISRDRVAHEYKAPGVMVNVNGHKVQLDCRGQGSPTVVFESGLDYFGSLSWTAVHDSIAKTTRACAWSRPGIMWSPGVIPSSARDLHFNVDTNAAILHATLEAAGEKGPWLLVGHSIGGPYAVVFASRYASEMAGLVMVDPSHPDQFARYREATGRMLMPTPEQARMGQKLAWTGLVRVMVRGGDTPAKWPKVIGEVPPKYLPISVGALADETAAVPNTLARMNESKALGDMPLTILQAATGMTPDELCMMKLTPEQGAAIASIRSQLLAGMATWSTRGKLEVVENTAHYIQFERPDAVIRAVNEMVGARVP